MSDPSGPADQDEAMVRMARFLGKKNALIACPVCSANNWQLLDRVKEPTMVPVMTGKLPTPGYVTYAMACLNCGYIRQHLAHVIDREAQEPAVEGGVP